MPGLLATLHPASGQSVEHTATLGNGGYTAATAAQLKDGSDATRAIADWYGDDFTEDEGHYREDWTLDACPANATWVISSIKVRMRVARTVHYGGASFYARPRFGPAGSVIDRSSESSYTVTAWKEFDFTANPDTGLNWTAAAINALKFGGKIRADAADASSGMEVNLIELQVQVWGDIVTAGTVAEMKGEALAAVATLITTGSLASCIGESITGHSAHGNTQGVVAEVVGEALEVDGPVTGPGPFVPVVTTVSATIRPTSPAALGDNIRTAAVVASEATGGTPDPNPYPVTLMLTAATLSDLSGEFGSIEHVMIGMHVVLDHTDESNHFDEFRVEYTVGGDTAAYVLDPAEWPMRVGPGEIFETFDVADTERMFGPFTTQPNGAPWTEAALSALVNLRFCGDAILGPAQIEGFRAAEFWIDVYGTPPVQAGDPSIRIFTLPAREVGPEVEAATLATGKNLRKSIGGSATRKAVIRS